MSEVTDNAKTLANALARIETLEAQKAHLLKVIKERKLAGYVSEIGGGDEVFFKRQKFMNVKCKPVYYISDEYEAAGILIAPEVKL